MVNVSLTHILRKHHLSIDFLFENDRLHYKRGQVNVAGVAIRDFKNSLVYQVPNFEFNEFYVSNFELASAKRFEFNPQDELSIRLIQELNEYKQARNPDNSYIEFKPFQLPIGFIFKNVDSRFKDIKI